MQEMNDSEGTCRFLQIWLTPDCTGHAPQYGSAVHSKADRHNRLQHLLGGTGRLPDWSSVAKRSSITLHQVDHCHMFHTSRLHALDRLEHFLHL